MTALSSSELKQKLALLKQKNHQIIYRSLWRSLFVSLFALSLLWCISVPYWQIKQQKQIQVIGKHSVSQQTIDSLLDLDQPQFIWAISNQKLAQKLEASASITAAKVTKQIFPPRLLVTVREKIPVAIALSQSKIGFLDREGIWLDLDLYDRQSENFVLPQLKVVNFQAKHRDSWLKIYSLIALYPSIKIEEVSWDEAANLFFKTELGTIYLGTDLSRLPEQFDILVKLKHLPNYFERSQIDYLDLSNPHFNLIQKYH